MLKHTDRKNTEVPELTRPSSPNFKKNTRGTENGTTNRNPHGAGNGNGTLEEDRRTRKHEGKHRGACVKPDADPAQSVRAAGRTGEPPALSIHPSPLPLTIPGQTLTVQCEASGFAPLSLEFSWEFKGADGRSRQLGPASVTGHRQAWDGTYSQSSKLELDSSKLDLGRGGEVTCVAVHLGGTQRASVTLNIIGFGTPSIEDSMAMVGVALVLYGLIKFASWTFTSSGADEADKQDKKDK